MMYLKKLNIYILNSTQKLHKTEFVFGCVKLDWL